MSNLFKLNVLATLVAMVGLGIGALSTDGVPDSHESGGSASELASLELPALPDECEDDCVFCHEGDEEHACHLEAGNGGSFCQHAETCTPLGDCKDHKCEPELTLSDLEAREAQEELQDAVARAVVMISDATPSQVHTFLQRNAHVVRRNEERGVIQFMGCSDGVIAQVPLNAVATGT